MDPLSQSASRYLLGAECAQRGEYGDAVLHMTTALEQNPALHVARLQLGLLWLTLGNAAAATATLQPLENLPDGDATRQFGEGLLGLCRDDLGAAAARLRAGISTGSDNAALVADMQRLLDAIEPRLQPAPAQAVSHEAAISVYTARSMHS